MTTALPPLLTPRPRGTAATIAAWLVIVACVIFVFQRNERSIASDQSKNALAALRIKMLGRMAFAADSTLTKNGITPSPKAAANLKGIIQAMDQLAQTPEDKFGTAIMAGELEGVHEAQNRLEHLAGDNISPELAADIAAVQKIYTQGANALSPSARTALVERRGFFGQVALMYGVPATQEPRATLVKSLLARLALASVGVVLLFLASATCFIVAIILALTGKIRRAYVAEPSANTAYLEGFALYLVLYITFGLGLRQLHLGILEWQWLALLIIPAVMAWVAWRGASFAQIRTGLGWQWGRGPLVEMALGAVGFLASVPLLAVGLYFSSRLTRMAGTEPNHPILGLLTGDRWHILELYGLGCVLAPVLEETMFRGALFHHLRRRWGWTASAMVVAFIFAIIHPQGWTLVPALGAIALMLAALREWRGSLLASMTAHACANFLAISMALLLLA